MSEPSSITEPTDRAGFLMAGEWRLAHARWTAPGADAILLADSAPEAPHGVRRGIVAAVAQDVSGEGSAAALPGSAHLALSGFTEGFFSARPTLSQGRAASQALGAINSWMYASHGTEALQEGFVASLSAVVFSGLRAGLIQIGTGMILRLRDGVVVGLAGPQLSRVAGGGLRPRRALGADDRILFEFVEDAPQIGDRYILLGDARPTMGPGRTLDQREMSRVCRNHAEAASLAQALNTCASVLIIDVLAMPAVAPSPVESETNALPLAPVPQEGDKRDGYLIGRTIHRGVYTLLKRATDTRTGQTVVLKFPLPAMVNDRVFQAGFAREAWIGATIHSPLIGRIITPEAGRQSSLYIVMPYYAGETLEARLEREPRLSVADILGIGLQLCEAVEALHALQVFHRDIKPDNIMLQAGGGLRLLDLGLAYLSQDEVSAGNDIAGTLRYMAPEMIRGAAPDASGEVYALGVILYRMAAFGRFPRFGTDSAAALERLRPELPPSLRQAIRAALQPEPAKRPQSPALLAEAIGFALHEDGEGAPPPSPLRRMLRDPLTQWRLATAVFALVVLGLLVIR